MFDLNDSGQMRSEVIDLSVVEAGKKYEKSSRR